MLTYITNSSFCCLFAKATIMLPISRNLKRDSPNNLFCIIEASNEDFTSLCLQNNLSATVSLAGRVVSICKNIIVLGRIVWMRWANDSGTVEFSSNLLSIWSWVGFHLQILICHINESPLHLKQTFFRYFIPWHKHLMQLVITPNCYWSTTFWDNIIPKYLITKSE